MEFKLYQRYREQQAASAAAGGRRRQMVLGKDATCLQTAPAARARRRSSGLHATVDPAPGSSAFSAAAVDSWRSAENTLRRLAGASVMTNRRVAASWLTDHTRADVPESRRAILITKPRRQTRPLPISAQRCCNCSAITDSGKHD